MHQLRTLRPVVQVHQLQMPHSSTRKASPELRAPSSRKRKENTRFLDNGDTELPRNKRSKADVNQKKRHVPNESLHSSPSTQKSSIDIDIEDESGPASSPGVHSTKNHDDGDSNDNAPAPTEVEEEEEESAASKRSKPIPVLYFYHSKCL